MKPNVVREIRHPALQARYEGYKKTLTEPGEMLLFHGCAVEALPSIIEQGFLKKFWTSAAGSWQRFQPGFYFALQSSKSHDYPLGPMGALPVGSHRREMLLCKVASGKVWRTRVNMDKQGQKVPPAGYDSVHGEASAGGQLNYDELVVFDESAARPEFLIVFSLPL